jgi:hypothetical protein
MWMEFATLFSLDDDVALFALKVYHGWRSSYISNRLTLVPVLFLHGAMPLPPESLLFTVQMALRKALKMVPGLRKQVGERDERVMAIKLVAEINVAYDIVKKPGAVGHVFDPPTGPGNEESGKVSNNDLNGQATDRATNPLVGRLPHPRNAGPIHRPRL